MAEMEWQNQICSDGVVGVGVGRVKFMDTLTQMACKIRFAGTELSGRWCENKVVDGDQVVEIEL